MFSNSAIIRITELSNWAFFIGEESLLFYNYPIYILMQELRRCSSLFPLITFLNQPETELASVFSVENTFIERSGKQICTVNRLHSTALHNPHKLHQAGLAERSLERPSLRVPQPLCPVFITSIELHRWKAERLQLYLHNSALCKWASINHKHFPSEPLQIDTINLARARHCRPGRIHFPKESWTFVQMCADASSSLLPPQLLFKS